MSSLRVTNYLLLVIASALALIAAKSVVSMMIPEAKAAPNTTAAVYLHGCLQRYQSTFPSNCEPFPVRVTDQGVLVTKSQ